MRVTIRSEELEGPKGETPPQVEGDSTMGAPELGAIERESWSTLAMGPSLEVGIYHGRTTVMLGHAGPVVAVEWLKGNIELAPPERRGDTGWSRQYQLDHLLPNLEKWPHVRQRVLLIEGNSNDILRRMIARDVAGVMRTAFAVPGLDQTDILRQGLHRGFGLILLDADKSQAGVLRDLNLVWHLLAPGGTLFLDDWLAATHDEPKGTVERAWGQFEHQMGLDAEVDVIGTQPDGVTPKLARIRAAGVRRAP